MTKREAERRNHQEAALLALGFTTAEAEQLRRISHTLQAWHEAECGSDSRALVRGRRNSETKEFEYDDAGQPYWEVSGTSGPNRYIGPVADREGGARKRLAAILKGVNVQRAGKVGPLTAYVQTDPRGAALYILRPGDVPDGKPVESYYDRGICVY